jgi:hypothetical protein
MGLPPLVIGADLNEAVHSEDELKVRMMITMMMVMMMVIMMMIIIVMMIMIIIMMMMDEAVQSEDELRVIFRAVVD